MDTKNSTSTDMKCVSFSECGKQVENKDKTVIDCQGFYGDHCTND